MHCSSRLGNFSSLFPRCGKGLHGFFVQYLLALLPKLVACQDKPLALDSPTNKNPMGTDLQIVPSIECYL